MKMSKETQPLCSWPLSCTLRGALFVSCFGVALAAASAATIPEHPLITTQAAVPLSMLVVGRDHTLFYEAYNDAGDVDGDGVLDIRFNPNITYYGLFDSTLCYSHSGGGADTDLFTPAGTAGTLGTCSSTGARWSGNWLNYATTSRIDALRKVFYGGYRDIDTGSSTVLRRAYIPQDAHSWAKEYTSVAVDGYDISDYTPLSLPNSNRRHFFGNLTATDGVNCSTLSNCSDLPPLLRVIQNSNRRVWAWSSTERPVLRANSHGGTSRTDYTVRVEVCTATYSSGCKRYPNGALKPIGLLHEYGEGENMLFGLLTGSYNKNMSGGVLRKVVSSFANEVDSTNGQFTASATIVDTLNSLRIRDFNNGRTDNAYRGGWLTTAPMSEGNFIDWGNPMAEMMYESLRYYAGKSSATTAFETTGSYDGQVGLPVATWDDPYSASSAAKAQWCARPSMLVVSGINPSFDSNQVPGCDSNFGSFTGDIGGLDVSSLASTITAGEGDIAGSRYIGQVGSNYDGAPTAKAVTTLGNIRGLAPEEPTKQGSYYSASVAHYGKANDLRVGLTGDQTVDTYAVVLSSPLPTIKAPTTSGATITLVPFAKSVAGSSISNTKGNFQPTNQIVDFFVDTIANSAGSSGADYDASINGGRYYAKFRINFEDVEQGADHDMDAIVVYEISAESDGTLRVKLTPEYQAGGINHSIGYVISGTTNDGVYLVVQDENENHYYYLNVPAGMSPGDCDIGAPPAACNKLPYVGGTGVYESSNRIFTPGTSSATLLKDPLWYAAKWGGFEDHNNNDEPDLESEWDNDGDSVPDTYFLVQNPLKLRESLKRSFDTIIERSASAGNITSNGQQIQAESKVFQTQFNSATWDGELFAYPVTASGVSASHAWKASEELPTAASRNIFTWKDSATKGIEFAWANLTSAQQTSLGSTDVLDYLRGEQGEEIQNAGIYRTRSKLLGDIVHSSPYYVKDNDTVYVGGNDGMLHAFAAETGVELFAYAPGLIFDKLSNLASATYTHTYFVDGDIAVSTLAQTPSANTLVASAGRGAKGLIGLDVTTPASFAASDVLWEYDATADDDLGYVLGRPQIGILEDDSVVAIFGNGHNSVNGSAVLYVLNLSTGALIRKIDTLTVGDNGMSTPALWDDDGNGKVDTVYAGDLKGNVWRFDLSSTTAAAWDSFYVTGTTPDPFFTALDASSNPKPITAQITVAINTNTSDADHYGKTFIFFGTGSYVYTADTTDTQVQTWYGLIDEDTRITSPLTALVERTFTSAGTVAGYPVRVFSAATTGDMAGKSGWFIDLDYPIAQGERMVTRSNLYQFLEPVLLASSIIPDSDPCEAGGSGYINAVNPFTGGRLSFSAFDLDDDAEFDDDTLAGDPIGSFDPDIGMLGEATIMGDRLIVGGSTGEIADIRINLGNKRLGRMSWREILGD